MVPFVSSSSSLVCKKLLKKERRQSLHCTPLDHVHVDSDSDFHRRIIPIRYY